MVKTYSEYSIQLIQHYTITLLQYQSDRVLQFQIGIDQKLSSCGLVPLLMVNLVPRQPFRCSTFLMFSSNFASTAFWAAFSSSLHLLSWALPSSAFFSLCSEAFLSSFLVKRVLFLKKESSMFTFTPSRDTLVVVASAQAGFTRPSETPLTEQGPVISKLPELSLLSTTTLLPLCTPDSRITTDPGCTEALPLEGLGWELALFMQAFSSSAGYQVLELFLSLLLGAPPKVRWEVDGSAPTLNPER